jgi:RNA 2',3'-cyclic 3'-phosphodiesterase
MAQLIRTFIAIELNELLHRALGEVQEELKQERAARLVRWVAPESIHVTIKFLGDVDAERLYTLQRAVSAACTGIAQFGFELRGIGAFPNLQRPNVIWVGAQGQIEVAALLAEKIEAACAALGFPKEERPFTPHLTLGRVKREASFDDKRIVGEMISKAQVGIIGAVQVERVSVMKSELRPGGSIYTRLGAIELAREG